jgi:3-carboxy-cis,cis-muconate cycloisomerase
MSELLDPMFGSSELTSDRAWVQAMLEVEAALARAHAAAGTIPAEHAQLIARVCNVDDFDLAALGEVTAASATPVVPLVDALRALAGDAADSVHVDATTQDIVDTATMLVAKRSREAILTDAREASEECARLAHAHRRSVMPGRTLLQHARPVTFGLKAAQWMTSLDEAVTLLARWRPAVQLGGPVGTNTGAAEALAGLLDLEAPVLPWHTNRVRIAELGGALGSLGGVAGKIAGDVILLAQTEVAEVREDTPGRSSSMPDKRNPARSIAVVACARRTPGLVATLLSCMDHEHERAAGAWQAEWETLRDLLRLAGGAASGLRTVLGGLDVDVERMREHAGEATADTDAIIDRALAIHTNTRGE